MVFVSIISFFTSTSISITAKISFSLILEDATSFYGKKDNSIFPSKYKILLPYFAIREYLSNEKN